MVTAICWIVILLVAAMVWDLWTIEREEGRDGDGR